MCGDVALQVCGEIDSASRGGVADSAVSAGRRLEGAVKIVDAEDMDLNNPRRSRLCDNRRRRDDENERDVTEAEGHLSLPARPSVRRSSSSKGTSNIPRRRP